MIYIKTKEEVEIIRESSLLVGKTHAEVSKLIQPGITTELLDIKAEEFIRDNGGEPAFKGYNGFPCTLCISVNNQVVHGIPGKMELNDGDIVTVDCGVLMNGFYGDSAYTYTVGEVSAENLNLLTVTKEALYKGIEAATHNNRVGDIGFAIQQHVESAGYSVVRELVGHGVGRSLHEKPEIPNYGRRGTGPRLKEGMVIAIEPMVNSGSFGVKTCKDGWTIETSDGLNSAHFEHTIAVGTSKADILSSFEYIDGIKNEQNKVIV
jgi:methionyl aminopeptidase